MLSWKTQIKIRDSSICLEAEVQTYSGSGDRIFGSFPLRLHNTNPKPYDTAQGPLVILCMYKFELQRNL